MESSIPHAVDGLGVRTGRRARQADAIDTPHSIELRRAIELAREAERANVQEEYFPRSRSERLNRAVNFTLALTGLILLSPLLILIALVVKLTSRGPIFYTQTRVGLDRRWKSTLALYEKRLKDLGGAAFTIYKFRSMYVDAEGRSGAVWATANDPRVTPLGRVLRKFRLDEFPQLINVVKGDMNIVGPRPERPSIVARLREDIKEYPCRQRVKPGITGLAQIHQTYDSCLEDVRAKVRYDLDYLQRQGMLEDVRIMIRTIPAVILKTRGW